MTRIFSSPQIKSEFSQQLTTPLDSTSDKINFIKGAENNEPQFTNIDGIFSLNNDHKASRKVSSLLIFALNKYIEEYIQISKVSLN